MKQLCVGLISFWLLHSVADVCRAWELIQRTAPTDPDVWQKIHNAKASGNLTEQKVREILGVTDEAPFTLASGSTNLLHNSHALAWDKKAKKDFERLDPRLKSDFNDFMTIYNERGLRGFYDNPGRWHLEKLSHLGSNIFSVRLNHGYRIVVETKEQSITIRQISKNVSGHQ